MRTAFLLIICLVSGCGAGPAEGVRFGAAMAKAEAADVQLSALADQMLQLEIEHFPVAAYGLGVPLRDHSQWADRSPEARRAWRAATQQLLAGVRGIAPANLQPGGARALHAAMLETLLADQATEICRFELWNVNHMGGWQLDLATAAREQPVGTAKEREQAIARWSSLPDFVAQEVANAQAGLSLGYSAPKPVVVKVIRQIEGLIAGLGEDSPLHSPIQRSSDQHFQSRFADVVEGHVAPALTLYRDFLRDEYLPRARDSLGVSAHPDGEACYRASLRRYTSLDRPPAETFRLGLATVEANVGFVRQEGQRHFGTDELVEIVAAIAAAPDNRFASEEEFLRFSREVASRSHQMSREFFRSFPEQVMLVEPFDTFRRGSGGSSYYQSSPDPARPAYFRINSEVWPTESRGAAEITAVHEGYPGHHMQIALTNETQTGPISKITSSAAFVEGWARYAEALAEEAAIFDTSYAPMTRRLWPARGMVADPGLHLYGWSRERVADYLAEPGRFSRAEADALVDRMAVWPGQLAAYDTGALEIAALRREAEEALGQRFNIRDFHHRILENGPLPLMSLREHVEAWIEDVR